ncbi:ATP-binding cassette domain-containing protein [Rhodococcus pyridinivorans]|nr:ATP-binding cassette domain-containing protein [Rhodococcus pyridinivorans]MCD2141205.1 ATP-binding cassette domain-containing protein [Rhodococcus pyridinivorans]
MNRTFGDHTAVSNLWFTVPPGSITGFLGPNGSGKTTTLGMMLGLVRPSAGNAFVDGVPFTSLQQPAQVVGAVLDARSAHPKHRALTHLQIYCAAIGVPDERARQMLDLVGLGSVARRRIGEFSLGMRQRLALATALLGQPRYLVLDEPANGLDPEGMAWLRDFLRAFAANGGTVLISSHILREIEQMADRLVIIANGHLVAETSMTDLRDAYRSRVFAAASDPARLATALAAAGHTDAQVQQDGRLAVVGVTSDRIAEIAATAEVTLFGTSVEHVDLEQVYLAMTAGRYAAAPVVQYPGHGAHHPPGGQYPQGPQYPSAQQHPQAQPYPNGQQYQQYPTAQQYPNSQQYPQSQWGQPNRPPTGQGGPTA